MLLSNLCTIVALEITGYWLLGLPKSSCISVEFQSVRSICYLLSSLFFFLSLSPYPLEQKKVMKAKVTEIDSLSFSLKIDLLNLISFSFSHIWLLCRKIFFFLSSPVLSIHFVSVFKQKKKTHTRLLSLSLSHSHKQIDLFVIFCYFYSIIVNSFLHEEFFMILIEFPYKLAYFFLLLCRSSRMGCLPSSWSLLHMHGSTLFHLRWLSSLYLQDQVICRFCCQG